MLARARACALDRLAHVQARDAKLQLVRPPLQRPVCARARARARAYGITCVRALASVSARAPSLFRCVCVRVCVRGRVMVPVDKAVSVEGCASHRGALSPNNRYMMSTFHYIYYNYHYRWWGATRHVTAPSVQKPII